MMNIEEIRDRLKLNPEPPEIEYIRNKITEAFKDIIFYPEPHKYFLSHEDGTQEELECVSNMAGRFVPEDDWDAIAERYAKKHNTTKELVQREWKIKNITSTTRGTAVHLAGENYNYFYRDRLDLIDPIIKPQIQDGWFIPLEGNKKRHNSLTRMFLIPPTFIQLCRRLKCIQRSLRKVIIMRVLLIFCSLIGCQQGTLN